MLKRMILSILILLSLSRVCSVHADMGAIYADDVELKEDSQEAIILHNLEEEMLILGTDLSADKKTTIMRFIPFPSDPKVALAAPDVFEAAAELIKKHGLKFLSRPNKGLSSSAESKSVELRFNAKLGAHDITVIKVKNITHFRQWVNSFFKGKGLPSKESYPGVEEVVEDYLKRGINYFVFDIVEITDITHLVEPVMYRFKSKKLYYPLKTTNTFGGEGGIDLIIISPVTLCDPLHSEALPLTEESSLYIKSLTEEESFIRKALGDTVQASTSAQISRADLKDVDPQAEKFFNENEPVFMQLIRYWGKYNFDEDILIDISQAPREVIDELNAGVPFPFDYKEMRELLKSAKIKPSSVADKKDYASRMLEKACMNATLSAIQMEIWRFEERFAAAIEGPGDPENAPIIEKHIEELCAEYEKYKRMSPANYVMPEKKTVKVKVTHAYQQDSILELKKMSRSGPFYHVAEIFGDDYESLKPGKTYRITIYLVYPRDYPFPSYYVYIEDFK